MSFAQEEGEGKCTPHAKWVFEVEKATPKARARARWVRVKWLVDLVAIEHRLPVQDPSFLCTPGLSLVFYNLSSLIVGSYRGVYKLQDVRASFWYTRLDCRLAPMELLCNSICAQVDI